MNKTDPSGYTFVSRVLNRMTYSPVVRPTLASDPRLNIYWYSGWHPSGILANLLGAVSSAESASLSKPSGGLSIAMIGSIDKGLVVLNRDKFEQCYRVISAMYSISNDSFSWLFSQSKYLLLGFLGGRNLGSIPIRGSSFPQHGYVVSNADYIGDPKATVYSYGPERNGFYTWLKRLFGGETADTDLKDWLAAKDEFTLLIDAKGDPISDKQIDAACENLSVQLNINKTAYLTLTDNSNSAAATCAANSGAVNHNIPGFAPGEFN